MAPPDRRGPTARAPLIRHWASACSIVAIFSRSRRRSAQAAFKTVRRSAAPSGGTPSPSELSCFQYAFAAEESRRSGQAHHVDCSIGKRIDGRPERYGDLSTTSNALRRFPLFSDPALLSTTGCLHLGNQVQSRLRATQCGVHPDTPRRMVRTGLQGICRDRSRHQ